MRTLEFKAAFALTVWLVSAAPQTQAKNPNEGKSIGWPGTTLSGIPCYGSRSGFGPYDYTDKANWHSQGLFVVEEVHFPRETETLTGKGAVIKSTDIEYALGADIDYTLRAFPNHHRALWSWVRLYLENRNSRSEKERQSRESEQRPFAPPECYLQRAIAFAPKDPVPHFILGIYLHRRTHLKPALEEYLLADKMQPNNAEIQYNLGLLYFDLGDFEKARQQASKAQSLGYPQTGLGKKLRRLSEQQQ